MDNFFDHQHKRLGILLAWGVGSIISGLFLTANPDPFTRQYGLQAALWGAIDTALALVGRRGAKESSGRLDRGEINDAEVSKAAQGFQRILLINSGLDVGYVLVGALLTTRAKSQSRKGMGLG